MPKKKDNSPRPSLTSREGGRSLADEALERLQTDDAFFLRVRMASVRVKLRHIARKHPSCAGEIEQVSEYINKIADEIDEIFGKGVPSHA